MAPILRPLSTSQLLDQTFGLYRKNFMLFAGIMALAELMVLALQLVPLALVMVGGVTARPELAIAGGLFMILTAIVSMIAYAVAHLATVNAVSAVYLDQPITVAAAYAKVKGKIGRAVDLVFSIGIRVAIGFLLLIIPGLRWMIRYSVALQALAIEDLKAKDAMKRSQQLTEGSYKEILLIYILFLVLNYIVAFAIIFPLVGGVTALKMGNFASQAAQHIANFISVVLVGPFLTIAMSLVYYDQRVRKEAFDLQLMMQGTQGAGGTAAAMASGTE